MVETVENPGEEGVHFEEYAFLAEPVELRVSIQEAGGDELVEDTHNKRWEHSEEDIVEG